MQSKKERQVVMLGAGKTPGLDKKQIKERVEFWQAEKEKELQKEKDLMDAEFDLWVKEERAKFSQFTSESDCEKVILYLKDQN